MLSILKLFTRLAELALFVPAAIARFVIDAIAFNPRLGPVRYLAVGAIGYVVFAFSHSYWLLLLSRVVQGAGGGTTGVISAYVADAVEPRYRARSLGWLSAATNLGVVLGPLSGSAATHLGPSSPGLIAACLCLVNIGFAAKYLTETHGSSARARSRSARSPAQAVRRVLVHWSEAPSRLIWMYAIGIGAFYGTTAVLVLYLDRNFQVGPDQIGFFFAYIGSLNILFRLGILGRVVERLGEVKTARLGAGLLSLGLFLIPFTAPLPYHDLRRVATLAVAVALLPLGTALNFPSVTALLSRVVRDHERGLYMGVQQTYGGVMRVVCQLWAGWAWLALGVGVPFWSASAMVAATIYLGYGLQPFGAAHYHSAVAAEARSGEHAGVVE